MVYQFPDAIAATREVVQNCLSMTSDEVVRWLPVDAHDRTPIIHVRGMAAPGSMEPWERQDRVIVDVYGKGSTEVNDIAQAIRTQMVGPQYTSQGVLDEVWAEVEPYEADYPHDTIRLVTATYRSITRPLPTP